jgi:hypothetical protein
MMAVLVKLVACNAKVIIFASSTSDEFSLGKHLDAAIARAVWLLWRRGADNRLLLFHESTRHYLSRSGLGQRMLGQISDPLRGAHLNGAVFDESLD